MSSRAPSDDDVFTAKINEWGLLLSVCVYGVHVTLFTLCIRSLWSRNHRIQLGYVLLLFALSTAAIGLQIWWTQVAFIDNYGYEGGPGKYLQDHVNSPQNTAVTAIYVLLNWFADGLLLYRFTVLWSLLRRRRAIMLIVSICPFLGLVVLGIVCLPEIAALGLNKWTDESTTPAIAYLALSLSLNATFTFLIIYRLLSLRAQVKVLGEEHTKKYTSLVAILVESASLYTVVSLITVIACGLNSPIQYMLLPMQGQLQAIPPLVIIYRAVEGRKRMSDVEDTYPPPSPLSPYAKYKLDDERHQPLSIKTLHHLPRLRTSFPDVGPQRGHSLDSYFSTTEKYSPHAGYITSQQLQYPGRVYFTAMEVDNVV